LLARDQGSGGNVTNVTVAITLLVDGRALASAVGGAVLLHLRACREECLPDGASVAFPAVPASLLADGARVLVRAPSVAVRVEYPPEPPLGTRQSRPLWMNLTWAIDGFRPPLSLPPRHPAVQPHPKGSGISASLVQREGRATPGVGVLTRVASAGADEAQSCGDGFRGEGEGCDDGNTQDGDGCSGACQVEAQHTCAGATPTRGPDRCGREYWAVHGALNSVSAPTLAAPEGWVLAPPSAQTRLRVTVPARNCSASGTGGAQCGGEAAADAETEVDVEVRECVAPPCAVPGWDGGWAAGDAQNSGRAGEQTGGVRRVAVGGTEEWVGGPGMVLAVWKAGSNRSEVSSLGWEAAWVAAACVAGEFLDARGACSPCTRCDDRLASHKRPRAPCLPCPNGDSARI
jgi:cysteine-rich repeat protein